MHTMGSCQHAGAGAANSVLVLNDQAACEAHFERDRLAVPAFSRVECSVSSQLPCDLRTNTATYICGSAQFPTGEPSAAQLRLRGGADDVEVHWTLASDASKALALYWVPNGGPAERMWILEPGCMVQQHTYPSHRWRLIDEQLQQVVREYTATHEPIQVIAITYVQPADLPHMPQPPQPAQLPQLQMADVRAPASDKSKGTLYAAINFDSSFGVYDSWGHVTAQRFKKIEYSPLSPASCGKFKRWADARVAAMEWLLQEGSAGQQAAVGRVRDSEQAAAAAAAACAEREAEEQRRAVAERRAVQQREMEEIREEEHLARERAEAATSAQRSAEHVLGALLADLAREVASEAIERAWVEAAEQARATAEQQAAAQRAEAAQCDVAHGLLAALVAEEAPGLVAEADAAVRAERAREVANQLAAQRRAVERVAAEERRLLRERLAAHDATVTAASIRTAAGAVAAVLARYPRWDRPNIKGRGPRTAEAKKRRFAKLANKQAERRQVDGNVVGASGSKGEVATAAGKDAADAGAAAAEARAKAAEARAAAAEARTVAERKRTRRDKKTLVQKARQTERSNGKATTRKRREKKKQAGWRAERKDEERVRKRKTPTGDALHSGERKHQRRVLMGGGGGSRGGHH
jgi:hypothetical protein